MNIKKHIPNFITLINLFCGCIAVVFIAEEKVELAFYFVSLGIFFDLFAGKISGNSCILLSPNS